MHPALGDGREAALLSRRFLRAAFDGFKKFAEGLFKKLYTFIREAVGDFLHGNAGAGEIFHRLARLPQPFLKAGPESTMISECIVGGGGDRVHSIGTDQFLDIQHVAESRILRAGAGPKNPLRLAAMARKRLPARIAEYIFCNSDRQASHWRWQPCLAGFPELPARDRRPL